MPAAGGELIRSRGRDLAALGVLLVLPVLWLNRVLVPSLSGQTLVPFDNLYAYEPWRGLQADVVPHNPLVSDLVLQSVVWEALARAALAAGELALWNPYVMTGTPFLAHAQGSALYPVDFLLGWLPLAEAFGWYTALHLSLAGAGMYVLGRTLGLVPLAALLSAVAFMFSGFLITSATFPQVLGAAAWLPWLLAVAERLVQHAERDDLPGALWVWLGGVVSVALLHLAGHPEIGAYGLLSVLAYSALRVAIAVPRARARRLALAGLSVVLVIGLGSGLAAVQLVPTWEAISSNARTGARTADELLAVAWPLPYVWTLALPDLFGNPTHRQWLDVWSGTWRESNTIFWGTKNYVEAGQYLGIMTWLLALVGVLRGRRQLVLQFGGLAAIALLFVFGSPLYLSLHSLPGFDQLRTPFRAVFPFSVAVCVLAGLGCDALQRGRWSARALGVSASVLGAAVLGIVGLSVLLPEPFLRLAQLLLSEPVWSERAFGPAGRDLARALPTPTMLWGYESQGLLRLGVFALAGGLVLLAWRRRAQSAAVGAGVLIALDLYSVHGQFLPATNLLLAPWNAPRPPVVNAVERLEVDGQPWRFITFDRDDEKTLLANAGMYYGWHDVRGYDSIIPRRFADLTRRLGLPPSSLAFNRISPIFDANVLHSPLLDLLNVRYVLTEHTLNDPTVREVYRDAHIAAYQKPTALPRAFIAPLARVAPADQQPLERIEPRDIVYLEDAPPAEALIGGGRGTSTVRSYTPNAVRVQAAVDGPAWLVLGDAWAPGWSATAQPESGAPRELEVFRAYTALRAVWLPSAGTWLVEFRYFPDSLRVGLALSGLSAGVVVGVVIMNRRKAWARARSAPSPPLRAPCSRAGRGA